LEDGREEPVEELKEMEMPERIEYPRMDDSMSIGE
jgi:hypothetical protein